MYQALTLSAGVAVPFQELGDFFRLLSAPLEDCTIIFYRAGAEVARAENVGAGFSEQTQTPFDSIRISSAAGGAVAFVIRYGSRVGYDKSPTGNVAVTNTAGAFTNTNKTVTNASGQLLAANAVRRYLLIQNNDATGSVYVTLDGTAATTAKGVKIAPGGSLEVAGYLPTGALYAIGSIASNANIVTVEG